MIFWNCLEDLFSATKDQDDDGDDNDDDDFNLTSVPAAEGRYAELRKAGPSTLRDSIEYVHKPYVSLLAGACLGRSMVVLWGMVEFAYQSSPLPPMPTVKSVCPVAPVTPSTTPLCYPSLRIIQKIRLVQLT